MTGTRGLAVGLEIDGDGAHPAAWRFADHPPSTLLTPDRLLTVGERAEAAGFGFVTLDDAHPGDPDDGVAGRFDPVTAAGFLSADTNALGLVPVVPTAHAEPFHVSNQLSSLDHASVGRAGWLVGTDASADRAAVFGWNVVTTDNDWTGENFRRGADVTHDDRYRHAEEHLATVEALWSGWPDGAVADSPDAESWSKPGAIEPVVRGARGARPSLPPSPQGRPVLFQAGESHEGREFAARHAQGIFSRFLAFDDALAFATDVRARLERHGRPGEDIKIFPATRILLGDTEAEARERALWFRDRTWSDRRIRATVEAVWGHDLSDHDVNGPLPTSDPVSATQTITHGVVNTSDRPLRTATAWRELTEARGWSMRDLVLHLNDTIEFVGTPSSVADELAHDVRAGAIDGLNLNPNAVPDGFDDVVDRLVPALQDRGVYRTAYEGTTLRENLGVLPR